MNSNFGMAEWFCTNWLVPGVSLPQGRECLIVEKTSLNLTALRIWWLFRSKQHLSWPSSSHHSSKRYSLSTLRRCNLDNTLSLIATVYSNDGGRPLTFSRHGIRENRLIPKDLNGGKEFNYEITLREPKTWTHIVPLVKQEDASPPVWSGS